MVRLNNNRSVRKSSGFGRIMEGVSEDRARELISEKASERDEHVMRLKEKFEKTSGLGFDKGRLDEMFQANPKKAENLLLFLENSEREASANRFLQENEKTYQALREAAQTSGFLGITPQDVVKISRVAYNNSHAQDIFDFWGMSSMKDTLFKLEAKYGSTARGATAGDNITETFGRGDYASEWEEQEITPADTDTFTGTLTEAPLRPFKVEVYLNENQIAADNGSGIISGTGLNPAGANTINYTTGDFSLVFTSALTINDELIIRYAYDSEQESNFSKLGSVLLNLVAYDYRAIMYPMGIEWGRFTEELMQSKLGMSAKEQLIQGAADLYRKGLDETCIARGIRTSNWTDFVEYDTDWASMGSDSSIAHAQGIISAIMTAEMKPYNVLGRQAEKTNLVVDTAALTYLTKHKEFVGNNPPSRTGVFKAGSLLGRDIYVAPPEIITPVANTGFIYIFGKASDGLSIDSPVSVGTYKTGLITDPVELKNFNSQMGLGALMDIRTNNSKFATKVKLTNVTPTS